MRISVISPSFNQAQFLPDNLRTVSGQTGVELEHILVDPGSTDGSLDLARAAKHAKLIAEPDRGQSHGITKGFERCTGDVMTWLNSDDFYPSPDTLKKVMDTFEANPDADIVYGGVNFVGEEGEFLRKGFVNKNSGKLLKSFHQQVGIVQPGVFWRRKVFDELGGPSEDYNYCMDYEYWVRMADAGFKWVYVDDVFAHHRWWSGMKTSSGRGESLIEHFRVCARYFGYIHWKWLDRYGEFRATDSDGVVNHADTVDEAKKNAHTRAAIEKFVTQDMLALLDQSDDPDHVETREYIYKVAPETTRFMRDREELPNRVFKHPDPHAEQRVAWHIFDTTVPDSDKTYKTYRVPDNFTRHFDADWYEEQQQHAARRMKDLSARRKETCVVVANGPSLNKTNFDLLEHADVMISNFAIINETLRRHATYFTVVNDLVASQGSTDFNQLEVPKLIPFWLGNAINPGENTVYLPATVIPEFCTQPDGLFSWRSTVSFFNMQLAYALGYEKVALIGFDHYFKQAAARKEGDSINQKEEDPNHFDPRYFKGKTWQAADTGNMEQMYEVAKKAYDAGGRSIVNATVGGKLEVFPRSSLEQVLGLPDPTAARHTFKAAEPTEDMAAINHPRLLVLDMTAMGNGSATGEVKSNLLKGWPDDRLLQVASPGENRLSLVRPDGQGGYRISEQPGSEIEAAIEAFDPQYILYRPVADLPHLHAFAMEEIARRDVPLATWLMDDWPARLEQKNPDLFAEMDRDLRDLLLRSELRLSISEAMSRAFEQRYEVDFVAYANGVDLDVWKTRKSHEAGPVRVRYAGGLAPDMNAESIQRVAQAVEGLANAGMDIRFEINTQPWWKQAGKELLKGLKASSIESVVRSYPEYVTWLQEADVLLVAYNFDQESMRYVRYSMANKMPECLASGAAILVHGPKEVATVDYLAGTGAARVVARPDPSVLQTALTELCDPKTRNQMAAGARTVARERHNLPVLARRLAQDLELVQEHRPTPDFSTWSYDDATGQFNRDSDALATRQSTAGLILYDAPEDVLVQAMQDKTDLKTVLHRWIESTEDTLKRVRRNRRQFALMEWRNLIESPQEMMSLLQQRFPQGSLPKFGRRKVSASSPILQVIAATMLRQNPTAQRLAAELSASGLAASQTASGSDVNGHAALQAFFELVDETKARQEEITTLRAGLDSLHRKLDYTSTERDTEALGRKIAEQESTQERQKAEQERRKAEQAHRKMEQATKNARTLQATTKQEAETLRLRQEQIVQLQATVETYYREGEALRMELAQKEEALDDLKRRLEEAQGEHTAAQEELHRIYVSRSWRVTEPLRGFRRAVDPSASKEG